MIALAKMLSGAIVVAALLRAAAALLFVACDFPSRVAVYFIEPQMVHWARCAQRGESLYPDWREFPYVADIYTPGYFWVVGTLSRAVGADLDGVMRIGRATTIFFSLLGAGAVGWFVRSKGRPAIAAAVSFAIGSVLMMGFGGMVRPDVTADVLGFIGFLAATASIGVLGPALILAAAVLCKQSAVIYLLAAVVALLWINRTRRAIVVSVVASSTVLVVLGLIWVSGERNIFRSVLLEAGSPWRWEQWSTIAVKFLARSGDVAILCIAGSVHWCFALRRNDPEADHAKRCLSLLVVGGGFALLGIAKLGSDLNYFLPLRYLAAVLLAEQISRSRTSSVHLRTLFASTTFLIALVFWMSPWWYGLRVHEAFNPDWRKMARIYEREIDAIDRLGKIQRVFTNCNDAALRVGGLFLDPYAFRIMVDADRIEPTALIAKLKNGEYDLVVTTGPLEDPGYRDSPFALPNELTEAILERYEKSSQGALVYYRPK
jgi:hypothetical protein